MAAQAEIVTACVAHAAAVKAAVANQAASTCGTFAAVRTMLIGGYAAVIAHLAFFADVAARAIGTLPTFSTVSVIIVDKAGTAAFAGRAFFPMAAQAEIVTACVAHAAAVKAAVANQAASTCGTFVAVRTMLIGVYAAINAHFAFVTPIRGAIAAGLVTTRTRGHVVKAGAAVGTVASFISGTVNVHMAVAAPIVVAAITTDLAVVFIVTVGVAAALTAVIAAVADPVISDKFMAKIAL